MQVQGYLQNSIDRPKCSHLPTQVINTSPDTIEVLRSLLSFLDSLRSNDSDSVETYFRSKNDTIETGNTFLSDPSSFIYVYPSSTRSYCADRCSEHDDI